MTILRLPRKSGPRAPSVISGINWASPLARGLAFCAPLFSGSPYTLETPYNTRRLLVRRDDAPLSFEVAPASGLRGHRVIEGSDADVLASTIKASDGGSLVDIGDFPSTRYDWTFIAETELTLIDGVQPGLWRGGSGSDSNTFCALAGSNGGMNVRHTNTFSSDVTTWMAEDARNYSIATVSIEGSNTVRGYRNGVETYSSSNSTTITAGDNLRVYQFGHRNNDGAAAVHGYYQSLAFFDHLFSAERAIAQSKYPYDIYQTNPRTISLPAAAAATSATVVPNGSAPPLRKPADGRVLSPKTYSHVSGNSVREWLMARPSTTVDGYGQYANSFTPTGTLVGSAAFNESSRHGQYVACSGSGDWVDFNDQADNGTSFIQNTMSFSLGWVIRFNSLNRREAFMGSTAGSAKKGFFVLREYGVGVGDNAIRLLTSNGSAVIRDCRTADSVITDTNWHYIMLCCTDASTAVRFYIDGKYYPESTVDTSGGALSTAASDYDTLIAATQWTSGPILGAHTDVALCRMWNRPLKDQEARAWTTNPYAEYYPPQRLVLPGAAATGTTVIRRPL